jgi:hypothetical protein
MGGFTLLGPNCTFRYSPERKCRCLGFRRTIDTVMEEKLLTFDNKISHNDLVDLFPDIVNSHIDFGNKSDYQFETIDNKQKEEEIAKRKQTSLQEYIKLTTYNPNVF